MAEEMKSYTVIVTRDATESVAVVVQAADAREASIKAETYVETAEDPVRWEVDDTPNLSKDIYITDVACNEPEPHTFTFTIGADVRAYGEVEVVAASYEEARAKLTEEYIQENLLVGDDVDVSGATRCSIIGLEVDGSSEHPHEPAGEDIPYVVDQVTVHPVFKSYTGEARAALAYIRDEDITDYAIMIDRVWRHAEFTANAPYTLLRTASICLLAYAKANNLSPIGVVHNREMMEEIWKTAIQNQPKT